MFKYILPIALGMSANALAELEVQTQNPHSVFFSAGFGDAEFKTKNKNNNSHTYDFDDNASTQFGYRYQLTDIFAIDTRYIDSSSFGFKQIFSFGLLDGTIDYDAFAISAQARKSMTQNSYLYANAGVARYDWEYKTKKSKLNESGFGGLFSLGYKYQWRKVELSVEHQWLTMGDMKASNYAAEVGYRF